MGPICLKKIDVSSSAPVSHPCRQDITIVVRDKDFIPKMDKKDERE